jgi:hypothetical protein
LSNDVVGVADAKLDPVDIAEVVRRHPRRGFHDLLHRELESKQPYEHVHHACALIAHRHGTLEMPAFQAALGGAPFKD